MQFYGQHTFPMPPLRRALFALLPALILLSSASAQAQTHFVDCAFRTGSNAHLLIPADVVASVGESPLTPGDELAAFTPDGKCAGSVVWVAGPMALTMWGDDSFTATKESFGEGEEIRLVVWDASSGAEYETVTAILAQDQPFYETELAYTKDGLYLLDELGVVVDTETPLPQAPIAEARAVGLSPNLSWTAVPLASSYELQISKDPEFSTTLINQKGIQSTNHKVQGLEEGTTYFWRVRALVNGIGSEFASSSFTTHFKQTLNLVQGWNLISSRIDPSASDLDEVYGETASSVLLVKNGLGQMYSPEFDINTIGEWSVAQGYSVYATNSRSLVVVGDEVPAETPLPLHKGWNTFAYWPTAALDAPTALASVAENVVIAKNGAGQVWLPEFGVNTMGSMQAGAGYLVHVTKASSLVYPAGSASKSGEESGSTQKTAQASIGANATLLLLAPGVEDGTRVLAKAASGTRIGDATIEDEQAVLVLRGDDDFTTELIEGALPGEPISIELEISTGGELQIAEYRDLLSGVLSDHLAYRTDGAWVAEATVAANSPALPASFQLEQNYPNPFNPSTTISYSVPEDAHVRLEVWNVLGQRVQTLVDEPQSANRYSIVFASDDLPSGVYFYTLQAGEHRAVRQMTLLK